MSEAPEGLDSFIAQPQGGSAPGSQPPAGLNDFVQQEQYGTGGQQALAGAEAIGRGATLGASDFLAGKISSPEAVHARQEANPGTAFGGTLLGGAGLIGATGGLAAPVAAGAGALGAGGLTAGALGLAAEGGLFGAGNAVSEIAQGDPNVTAQKVLSHIGVGAALGVGLGALFKGAAAVPALFRAAKGAAPEVAGAVDSAAPAVVSAEPVVDAPMKGVQPTSFDQMQRRVDEAVKYGGQSIELPQKAALEDAASRLELSNPVHPLQMESLESQDAKNLYNVARDLPGKEGQAIRGYEALQKNELTGATDRTIQELAPETPVTSDAVKSGNRAIEAFTDNYQNEQKALKPILNQLNETSLANNLDHQAGAIDAMTQSVPGVARMFDTEAEGALKIKPYSTSWGIDKSAYTSVKQAVGALEENPDSFRDLANIREGMSQNVNTLDQGPGPQQVRALKAGMMNYIQKVVQDVSPDAEVRSAFQRWAVNEQQRSVIERVFGASVGSPEFGAISKIKPESIVEKIFSNTANVKAAKSILEPEQFQEMLGNYLAENRALATDKGAFSANKFGSFLRRNQDALGEAFQDNPQSLQKLQDLTTIARILPDAASINPSGTAKTLLGSLKADSIIGILKNAGELAKEHFEHKAAITQITARLAGQADQATKLKAVQSMAQRVGDRIQSAAKDAVDSPAGRAAVISGAAILGDKEFEKISKRLKELSNDPQAMMDHASDSTQALYSAAPDVSQGISSGMMRAVQFLSSKLPQASNQLMLSGDWEPSKSQLRTFSQYYSAVNDPVSVLEGVKSGSVPGEAIDALQAVHPDLLQEMRTNVLTQMKPERAKELPYGQKLAVAKFLGQPLDQSMTPQMIISNQTAINAPSQSTQNAPQSGRKTTLGGLKQMQAASRAQTSTNRDDEDA